MKLLRFTFTLFDLSNDTFLKQLGKHDYNNDIDNA